MENLRRLTWINAQGRGNSLAGRGIGNANFPSTRTVGSGVGGATTGAGDSIEIHLIQDGGNRGNVVGNSGMGNLQPFNSGTRVDIRGGLAGSSGFITDEGRRESRGSSVLGNNENGAPGTVDSSIGSSVGSGAYTSRVVGGSNVGFGNSGSLRGNTEVAAGIVRGATTGTGGGIRNGNSVASVSVSNVAATEGRRTGGGASSAAVVGISGTTMTSRGNGIGANGGVGTSDNAGRDMSRGDAIGVGGVFSSRNVRGPNSLNVETAAIGGSYLGSGRPGSSRIGGGSGIFSGAAGSFNEGAAPGRGARAGARAFSSGNNIFGADDGDELGSTLEDDEGSSLGETDFANANALASRRRYGTGFRG